MTVNMSSQKSILKETILLCVLFCVHFYIGFYNMIRIGCFGFSRIWCRLRGCYEEEKKQMVVENLYTHTNCFLFNFVSLFNLYF